MKSKAYLIIEVVNNLRLIQNYFIHFCPNLHSENINYIQKEINILLENYLNYFEIHYSSFFKKYEMYLNEAEQILKKVVVNFISYFMRTQEKFMKRMT